MKCSIAGQHSYDVALFSVFAYMFKLSYTVTAM